MLTFWGIAWYMIQCCIPMSLERNETLLHHSISQEHDIQPTRSLHLLYHELRPSTSAYSYVIEPDEFERQLDLFVQLRGISGHTLWPEITFDDGHRSNFEFALPILQSRGLRAHFFITAGWMGNKPGYMKWEELRSLHEAGQLIGAHGWTHTLLTHCSTEDLLHELSDAKRMLEDKLGTSITTMSLPGGRSNRQVLAACKEAGYTHIYTSVPKSEPSPLGFTVGRLNIRREMTLEWLSVLFSPNSRALSRLNHQYKIKAGVQSLLGDAVYEKLWAILNRKEQDTITDEAAEDEGSAHNQ
jgi:peptidoglycan/xylan/chitin deacetylase (PgdA/CDA1 family)